MAKIQNAPFENNVRITERSLLSERFVFIEALKQANSISPLEYDILDEWFIYLDSQTSPVSEIIYLRSSPATAFQRLRARSRLEEKTTSLKYVTLLHDLHEKWLVQKTIGSTKGAVITVIDIDQDLPFLLPTFHSIAKRISLLNKS
jgi:deoxyadenosine/deoxycytidine kinase